MRQPKYAMGEEVEIDVDFQHKSLGLCRKITVAATVNGVFYDPQDDTNGGPYYTYRLFPKGASTYITVQEHGIT